MPIEFENFIRIKNMVKILTYIFKNEYITKQSLAGYHHSSPGTSAGAAAGFLAMLSFREASNFSTRPWTPWANLSAPLFPVCPR